MTAAPAIPLQKRFDWTFSALSTDALHCFGKPLARMDECKAALRCDEDHVLYLLDDKQIFGFDLRGKRAKRRVPGVWRPSLFAAVKKSITKPSSTEEMINDILPRRDWLHLSELTDALTVVPGHIHHWIRDRLLIARGGDRICKAPQLSRASVAAFLKSRRIA
jgi:hypothetical protein